MDFNKTTEDFFLMDIEIWKFLISIFLEEKGTEDTKGHNLRWLWNTNNKASFQIGCAVLYTNVIFVVVLLGRKAVAAHVILSS